MHILAYAQIFVKQNVCEGVTTYLGRKIVPEAVPPPAGWPWMSGQLLAGMSPHLGVG